MKNLTYIMAAAIFALPATALGDHPEGNPIDDIKSEIREDYLQLHEDNAAGNLEAIQYDKRIIAEDKARLREAQAHPHMVPPPPVDRHGPPPSYDKDGYDQPAPADGEPHEWHKYKNL